MEGIKVFLGVMEDPFILNDLYLSGTATPRFIIPKMYCQLILHLEHRILWAGHRGQAKTYGRISQMFYCLDLYRGVQDYCKSCHACQVVAPACKSDRDYS